LSRTAIGHVQGPPADLGFFFSQLTKASRGTQQQQQQHGSRGPSPRLVLRAENAQKSSLELDFTRLSERSPASFVIGRGGLATDIMSVAGGEYSHFLSGSNFCCFYLKKLKGG
jgi:hypothetical protein